MGLNILLAKPTKQNTDMNAFTVALNRFDGGMVNDPRIPSVTAARLIQHFDCLTDAHRLIPTRGTESGDSSASTDQITNFAYTNGILYGLGVQSGSSFLQIYSKTDFTNSTWTTPASSSANVTFSPNVFVVYHGHIYGLRFTNPNSIVYNYNGATSAFTTTSDHTLAANYINTAQGVVHSKDDTLYIPYDNFILSNNNGAYNDPALTLPSYLTITSICEYGNLLAIACRSINNEVPYSRVYLWDRNSSLTTLSESIDWGQENVSAIEEINGSLVGVSMSNSANSFGNRLVFRTYAGSGDSVEVASFISSVITNLLHIAKQKIRNRLYFLADFTLRGNQYQGVWSCGIDPFSNAFSVNFEHVVNNNNVITGKLNGFFKSEDFMFISYQDASAYAMSKTISSSSTTAWTTTSAWESLINEGIPPLHRTQDKQLITVSLSTEPLANGQQVLLFYKVDGGGWTQILTANGTGTVTNETGTDSGGLQFSDGREYEFRIESTGGAVVTELKYKMSILSTLI